MKLVTSKQIQEIDRIAVSGFKIPSLTLMENAGRKASEIIQQRLSPGDSVLIAVGKGNNGGDGLVIARHLLEKGLKVQLVMTALPEHLSHDARSNWDRLEKLKPGVILIEDESNLAGLDQAIKESSYIIDAIFGTGLNSEVRGRYRKLIDKINAGLRPVISIDIPSGLSADTGEPLGVAIKASLTITFGLPKIGQVLPPGPEYVKELLIADIGFPSELIESYKTGLNIITPELFKGYFADRKTDAHKGDFGHVLVVAGSTGKMGAGWLTSMAALRSGAGLVTYCLPEAAFTRFDTQFAEVMVEPVLDKKKGYFVSDSIEDIKKACLGKNAVAFGPGIGTKKETVKASCLFAAKLNLPLVIDADGLNNLSESLSLIKKRRFPTVMTPHPGEMARLTGMNKNLLPTDRVSIARTFAKEYSAFLVLKGFRTIVAAPDGEIYLNTTGNPGMATAGMGDALTGMITAFLARKVPPLQAVLAAVYIHGLAGDLSAAKKGEIGIITSDLIDKIPEAIGLIRQWVSNG